MDPTAITVVSQLITDARTRYGADAVVALEVVLDLLDGAMAAVLELGGTADVDSCEVEGVEVRELPAGEPVTRVWLAGEDAPRRLDPIAD